MYSYNSVLVNKHPTSTRTHCNLIFLKICWLTVSQMISYTISYTDFNFFFAEI